jgi:hypothetical protein
MSRKRQRFLFWQVDGFPYWQPVSFWCTGYFVCHRAKQKQWSENIRSSRLKEEFEWRSRFFFTSDLKSLRLEHAYNKLCTSFPDLSSRPSIVAERGQLFPRSNNGKKFRQSNFGKKVLLDLNNNSEQSINDYALTGIIVSDDGQK